MFQLIEGPKVVPVSRALAKKFRDMPACERDRPYSEHRASFLTNEMAKGRFRTCEWASAVCDQDGKEYRVNGKHTSTIMADAGPDLKLAHVHAIVSKYKCHSKADVASLYATFDSKSCARNFRDINLVFAGSVPQLSSVPPTSIHTCVSGMAFDKWENNQKSVPSEARSSLILDNVDFVLWFHSMSIGEGIARDARDILRRGPVAAAMFKTYRKSKAEASKFWEMVRDASHPKNTHPTRTLNKYLAVVGVHTGHGMLRPKTASFHEITCKCVSAWNAYRKGERSMTFLAYHPGKTVTPAAA